MTTAGFITVLILLTIALLVLFDLAGMPGRNARERNHPSADAISILGWLGLLFGGVPWLIAMVWARMDPVNVSVTRPSGGSQVTDSETTNG